MAPTSARTHAMLRALALTTILLHSLWGCCWHHAHAATTVSGDTVGETPAVPGRCSAAWGDHCGTGCCASAGANGPRHDETPRAEEHCTYIGSSQEVTVPLDSEAPGRRVDVPCLHGGRGPERGMPREPAPATATGCPLSVCAQGWVQTWLL